MNYYERHIGDYIRDTVSLTMLEDGAYNRLMDQCYQTERPLPMDRKMVYRLARATSAPERKAVDFVIANFFELIEGVGYEQKRIRAEIERYQEKNGDAEDRRENERERQRRHRERRKQLFQALRDHGEVPPYDTSTEELQAMLSRVTNRDTSPPVTQPVTRDVTANQTPDTRHQKEKNTMSGKPDDADPREVLAYLNEQTGKSYRAVETNLKLIRAKLDSGATLDDCKAVIDAKVEQWGNDPKMVEYLRPETLFGARKFEQYLGQLTQQALPNPAEEAALADGARFIPGVGRCY